MKYPVYECFYTWQGEGVHMGRAAYFIRLYGCPQSCPWCDSAGTWHPAYRPRQVDLLSVAELVSLVVRDSPDQAIVVLTGGEPIMFDLEPLTSALHSLGRRIHLETSGIAPLRGAIDWLTLSPKPTAQLPLSSVIEKANEIKIIVHDPSDIQVGLALLIRIPPKTVIWLHPEWSKARERNVTVLNAITEAVKLNPRLRAGYQIHKLYRADELDQHSSKRPVPLGGDLELGF